MPHRQKILLRSQPSLSYSEMFSLLRYLNFQCLVYRNVTLVLVLSRIIPNQIFKCYSILILQCDERILSGPFQLSNQNISCISCLFHECYMLRPYVRKSNKMLFDTNIPCQRLDCSYRCMIKYHKAACTDFLWMNTWLFGAC